MDHRNSWALIAFLAMISIMLFITRLNAETCPCTSDWTGQTYTQEQYSQYQQDNTIYLWGDTNEGIEISKKEFTLVASIFGVLVGFVIVGGAVMIFQTLY